ncbi:MAG: hypothetical protein LBP42_01580 [Treponema sp.]|jgi:hypothetical protein|nr:hypothetical protein [Treponema sp.]
MVEEKSSFSALTLERYCLGEVTAEEKGRIEAALGADSLLAERLAELRRSDREILSRYPPKRIFPGIRGKIRRPSPMAPIGWALAAAALILAAALPILAALQGRQADPLLTDRAKGGAELSIYLKPASSGAPSELKLAEKTILREGLTIQLAYMVEGERYGIIFSIDGRSAVTVHYPYGEGQSTRLVSGKRTFLDEAYTLDDAPDYELFFFIIGDKPLDMGNILDSARELARDPKTAPGRSAAVFKGYEVKTFTLYKE